MAASDAVERMTDNECKARELTLRLGPDMMLTGTDEVAAYCTDWHGDVTTGAVAVLRPRSTDEVCAAVNACRALGLGIVPQGGRTGLTLGGVPSSPETQAVLSLERMTQIRNLDLEDFTAVVEAGVVLEAFKQKVAEAGLFFPLALGAQGSCQIGGNVSTNAGGVNVLRYGMTRELVLGIEAVLPDGRVFNGLSRLRKDNRGVDLKQLFIGAEGTLGIITAVSVKLFPAPGESGHRTAGAKFPGRCHVALSQRPAPMLRPDVGIRIHAAAGL